MVPGVCCASCRKMLYLLPTTNSSL
ncbi:hypothetical protein FP803_02300 [Candidatus Woesearchaeota archaeon]|nr:hypothetical protein [Candidatus Woesearchaeota archaeon]